MSIKVRVSYEDEGELALMRQLLDGYAARIKVSKESKGQYKRAYFDIKSTPTKAGEACKNVEKS